MGSFYQLTRHERKQSMIFITFGATQYLCQQTEVHVELRPSMRAKTTSTTQKSQKPGCVLSLFEIDLCKMYSPANDRLQHFRRRDHSMAKEYVHWEYHKKQEHNYWVNRDVVWKRVTYYEPGIDERITMYVEDSDNRVTQILDEDYTSDQNESNDDTFQFKRNFDRDSRRSYRKHRRQCADGSDNDSRRSFREGSEILYNSKYHQSKHVSSCFKVLLACYLHRYFRGANSSY